ncbi:hypothetical protein [Pseudodonghicola flavimaris]|uniref:DUF2783 domain-containing protein n=1 Tax=Pseudodonghicola flavimaris TaxID=3050036 RepID=A0ABT7F3F9_9RHOB|nr:hypothetical protein [Pseudodonghicola flavimaris]MDK3019150.1 hypothetical protein [Pseudodonghicola flavimaris]
MTDADLERLYEAMAETLGTLPRTDHALYLAKLALALAETLDDTPQALAVIAECRQGLLPEGAPA